MWAASPPAGSLGAAGEIEQNSVEQKPLPTLAATLIPQTSGRWHASPVRAQTALASAGVGELWAAVAQKGYSTKVRQRDALPPASAEVPQNGPEDS